MKVSKRKAAERQLNFAVEAFFRNYDPVVVHTLAGAAGIIFHDLVEKCSGGNSWESIMAKDNRLSKTELIRFYRRVQNFLKHADRDPEEKLEFDPEETEHVIYFASMNWSELCNQDETVSIEISIFQLWYQAVRPGLFNPTKPVIAETIEQLFPNICELNRDQQIRMGLEVMKREAQINI